MAPEAKRVTLLPGAASARVRLFCFPHAGAGVAAYRAWRPLLPPDVELALVHLPGREARLAEPPATSMDALLDDLAPALAPHAARPYALFGHSMGALLAHETARRLLAAGHAPPARLFVSGHRAPHLPDPRGALHERPDRELLPELERLGGTPRELLDHPEMMALVLPVFRADLALCASRPRAPAPPLPCAITAFAGADDPVAPPASVGAWDSYGSGFRLHVLPGGHFFVQAGAREVLRIVASDLAAE